MARYIDAELFAKNLAMEVYFADDEDFTKAFVRGIELVKKAETETPTADVVEVVKCKECAIPHNQWTGCPKLNGLVTPPDFYCGYGERRKGNG